MFKFFKKSEGASRDQDNLEQAGQKKELVESEYKGGLSPVPERPEEGREEESFESSVQDMKEYLNANNGKIDPETIELMTGMSLEETLERLEKDGGKMELSVRELQESVVGALKTLEEPARENWLRKALDKPVIKGIFVTVMLFLKFSPDAKGAEKKEIDLLNQNKNIESSSEDGKSIDDANTYQADAKDFESNEKKLADARELDIEMFDLARFSQLQLSNYYETDSDFIPEHNKQEIINQFTRFLDNINADNFQEIAETDFEIFGSSDERLTNNWEGSNEKLTKARIAAAEEIFRSVLDNYDFGNRLNQSQVDEIKNKEFKAQMPEGGVTYLLDLINPNTGKNYSEEEISSLSEEDRLELLKDCRRVDANFLAKKPALESIEISPLPAVEIPASRIDNLKNTLNNWNDYYAVAVVFDVSPSTEQSYKYLADLSIQQPDVKNTKISFGTFSNSLESFVQVDNLEQMRDLINGLERNGSHQELALHAAMEALDQMRVRVGQKMKLIIATDEPLQGLSYQLINGLKIKAEQKNCEVDFIYAHNRQGGAAQILSLEELYQYYQESSWEQISRTAEIAIEAEERKVGRLERTHSAVQERINSMLDRDSRSDRRHIDSQHARLAELSEDIKQSGMLIEALRSGLKDANIASTEQILKDSGAMLKYGSRLMMSRLAEIDPASSNIGIEISLSEK